MTEPLKLLCTLAHPDDESMGTGPLLAKYSAEGVQTHLICATRGERGWSGPQDQYPGLAELGKIRQAELLASAQVLGVHQVHFLDYIDGDLVKADPLQGIAKLTSHIRRIRPQVVVTFDPEGAYGHPDHITISQWTAAAILCAADPAYQAGYQAGDAPPHRVSKLYYFVDTKALVKLINDLGADISFEVDGKVRTWEGWPDWAITARIDAGDYCSTVWEAIQCHKSQTGWIIDMLKDAPPDTACRIWGEQSLYRVFSLVNHDNQIETDLFEGLR